MSMNIREPKDKYVKEFIRDVIDKLYRDSIEKEKALNEEDRQYTEWKEEKLQHAFLNPDDEQRMQEWDDNIKHKYKLNSIYLEDAEETMNLPEFMNESMFKEMTLEKIRDIVSKNEAFYNALDEGIYSLWKEVVERRKREEKPALSAKLVKELEEDREIGLIHEAFGDVKTHFLIEAVYAKILKKWVEVKETPSAPTSFTGFVKDFIENMEPKEQKKFLNTNSGDRFFLAKRRNMIQDYQKETGREAPPSAQSIISKVKKDINDSER